MAAFIASYLLSAQSMEHSNCLRWGLQRRSLSSFDWPVGEKKDELSTLDFIEKKINCVVIGKYTSEKLKD